MQIIQRLRALLRRTEGQDLIEYGLLLGMISAAIVATIPPIATKVAQPFQQFVAAGSSGGGNPGNGNPGNGNPGNPGNGNPGNGNPGNSNPVGNAGPNPGNGNGNGNGN